MTSQTDNSAHSISPTTSSSSPSNMPTTMRALTHTQSGLPTSVLSLSTTHPVPSLSSASPSSTLIKVSHASLNPGGTIVTNFLPFFLRKTNIAVPEMDFSGYVIATNSPSQSSPSNLPNQAHIPTRNTASDQDIPIGTKVFGSLPVSSLTSGQGACQEYLVVEKQYIIPLPTTPTGESALSLAEASGLPIAGTTALHLISTAQKSTHLRPGAKVLINGASGGIGHFVLQLAKEIVTESGHVAAICSLRNKEMVMGLGADEVIAYDALGALPHGNGDTGQDQDRSGNTNPTQAPNENDLITYLAHPSTHGTNKFTCILDCRGVQGLYSHSANYLTENGVYVTVGPKIERYTVGSMLWTILLMLGNQVRGMLPGWAMVGPGRRYLQAASFVSWGELERLRGFVSEGRLRVVIEGGKAVEMVEWKEAFGVLERGRARGKVVMKIKDGENE